MRHLSNEGGFTFVELLAVVLLLGILVLVALPNYFGAEDNARQAVDKANVRSINAALALYRFKNNGTCPADTTEFNAFMANTLYFPDGAPTDPWTSTSAPYATTYSAPIACRVLMTGGTPAIDHGASSSAGHGP